MGCILGVSSAYVAIGVAYGRHKNPPLPGDGVIAHPDGLGAIAWHPHYGSVSETIWYTRRIFGVRYFWFLSLQI